MMEGIQCTLIYMGFTVYILYSMFMWRSLSLECQEPVCHSLECYNFLLYWLLYAIENWSKLVHKKGEQQDAENRLPALCSSTSVAPNMLVESQDPALHRFEYVK